MKFSNAVILAAATGAYADIAAVKGVLGKVSTSIGDLDTAAQGFNGDVKSVQDKADALVKTIKDGKTTVDGSSDLSLADALGLQEPVQELTKKGQTLADNFKSKRDQVEKAGACGEVRSSLVDINSGSKSLIQSVVDKVPKDAQPIAESLASGLTKVLAQAQEDFSESNCKDSGASNPGPSGSASHSEGASQTSAPASTAAPTAGETSAPATTMAPSTTAAAGPTGNSTATAIPPPVTAGASFLAPAGALVMAVAAALL